MRRGKTVEEACCVHVNKALRSMASECWEWLGYVNHGGYPTWRPEGLGGKRKIVTRIAYEHHYGVNPGDLCVLHKCDNRRCLNPEHLFLGTRGDNAKDRTSKGRDSRGVDRWNCKLTPEQVVEIRKSNEKASVFVKRYGISYANVGMIRKRQSWRYLED